MGRTRNKSSPAGQPKLAREIKGLTCLVPQRPFGQESLSPGIRTRIFEQAFCKRPFDQDLVYVNPVDGLEYQKDIRTENVGPDNKGKIDVDNILEESMEKEETKGEISQEDPDLEEGSGRSPESRPGTHARHGSAGDSARRPKRRAGVNRRSGTKGTNGKGPSPT